MPGMPVADPSPEKPVWPLALLVALADLVLLGVAATIFVLAMEGFKKDLGTTIFLGLPALYLAQIVIGVILFASPGMRRLGRGLLFGGVLSGVVMFLAVGGLCIGLF